MTPLESVLFLMSASEVHREWTIEDLSRLVAPPLALTQCEIFVRDGWPVAFISWAFLNKVAADGFIDGTRKLQPDDWSSGDQLWIIDIIAPYGDIRKVIRWAHDKWPKPLQGFHIRSSLPGVVRGRFGKVVER
jgi:cytolysin-activating lysine-acyltransferase